MSLTACDQEDLDFVEPLPEVIQVSTAEDGSELVTFRNVVDNGTFGNGYKWNGYKWNGYKWNGYKWNGYKWNGVEFNAESIINIVYDSTNGTLSGEDTSTNTVTLGTSDVMIAQGDLDDGTVVAEVKVSEIEQFTSGSHAFQFQRIQTRTLETADPEVWNAWEDGCLDGGGNPTKAILLKGDWSTPTYSRVVSSEDATTWACRGAALAKCVEWGYHPEGVVNSTVLGDHHQACTRLVRADYCGNGVHHTENGTLIDVEDSLGIQTHDTTWDIEAAWGVNGALCLNNPRKTWWTRNDAVTDCSTLPSCDANSNADLTDDKDYWMSQGALFVTRNQPSALLVEPPAEGG